MVDPVTPQLAQVVFDTTDARRSAEFWRQLLGLAYRQGHEPPTRSGVNTPGRELLNLIASDGSPRLAFQQVDELPRSTWPHHAIPQQLHLDLTVRSVRELEEVRSRILTLGGPLRLDRTDDVEEPLRVYLDPDGHPFCVFVFADN